MRCALVVLLLLTSSVAVAQPNKIKAEAASRDGQQRYQAGEFLLAAERFELAYSLEPDPAYLFNLAQSYRLGLACVKAAASYRQLLTVVTTGPNVEKVQQYIVQMDACAKTQTEPVTPPTPPEPQPSKPIESPPPPVVDTEGGKPALRYAGIGVGAAGVLAVGFGVFSTIKVVKTRNDREALCANGCIWMEKMAEAAELDAAGKRYQRRQVFGYVGGGVAIAGGIVLYLLGREHATEQGPVSIVPTEGGAMALTSMSF